MFRKGGRVRPQINGYVVDRTAQDSNQFRFGGRWDLKVQSAHSAPVAIERQITLGNVWLEALCRKLSAAVSPRKKAPIIFE
jgi:hypothetical protein